jgi:hypothetical protein
MHLLHVAHLEDYRRMMGARFNVGEGRNGLARGVLRQPGPATPGL